ncbi:RHS repeat-associated core domain-containing protein [Chitinophaga oryzae]|uniref:RHS repeat-associated core domain-containing protein n=1 Tax=Chitinophaga oryzae TaxID=2725414 RepID=A0AAE6ZKD8_9BACT|nr:RHS repeat-associated core domain-containing protein [Chitinophaga oryzae]QJB33340.1 RHS repeat-associated core domain-containing protein [Chitinophaga oryzae]
MLISSKHFTPVWIGKIDIYGQVQSSQADKSFEPFRYAGQYKDAETGLAYNRFRYYDASTGLYISQDPLGPEGENLNFYTSVRDSKEIEVILLNL